MMRVAVSIKLRFRTFDTNGKLRDARRLHSITFTSLFLARNWMLNGPLMFNSLAIILLDTAGCFEVDLLCREYQCRVTGMDTGKLDMFGDCVLDHFAIHGYRVEFYLFRPLQEFGNNYRIFFGNLGCQV